MSPHPFPGPFPQHRAVVQRRTQVRYRAVAGAVALATLAAGAPAVEPVPAFGALPATAALPAAVTIDYVMAPRLGPDRNHDGIPNDPHNTARSAQPDAFSVTLDGCANASSSYQWRVGALAPFTTTSCRTTVALPAGLVPVVLTLADGRRGATIVWVRDILIVALGDSVASGEGNPDVAAGAATPARWQNARCHRSARSGPALAARRVEELDPHSSVTFVHLACSGAGIATGILGPYAGIAPQDQPLASQIDQVRSIIGDRRISALVITAGANDVGFGGIVQRCIVQDRCDIDTADARVTGSAAALAALGALCTLAPAGLRAACDELRRALGGLTSGPSAARVFDRARGALAGRYARLAERLAAPRAADGLGTAPRRVLLTEYYDPSGDEQARPCDPARAGLDVRRILPGVSGAEFSWVRQSLVPQLNAEAATAAGAAGWQYVAGIAAAFAKGGYCADRSQRLVRRIDESLRTQHTVAGTLHPNGAGHQVYADRIGTALDDLLF